jgi:threonine aldolase
MAKKQKANKTQAVRDYLKTHPKAMSGEIATELNKQGIKVTPNYVSNIKTKLKKSRKPRKAAKQTQIVDTVEVATEKPVKNGTLTLDQVKKVSQLMKTHGGFPRVVEVLDVVRDLGGVKKFKELAAAIAATEPNDMPF